VPMEWLLPTAEAVICAAMQSNDDGFQKTSVAAYAHVDRLFAKQVSRDTHLQDVLFRLREGSIDFEQTKKNYMNDPALNSTLMTILRALVTRGSFALEQKLTLLSRLDILSDDEKPNVIEEVNNELKRTLEFVKMFQQQFSPELDVLITQLEIMEDDEKLGNGDAEVDDESTAGTEESDDDMSNDNSTAFH
jgi:hypothetical protein